MSGPLDDDEWNPSDEHAPDAPPSLDRLRSKRSAPVPRGAGWEAAVVRDKEGHILGTSGNLTLHLVNHPEWKGCLGYNGFAEREVWLRDAPTTPGLRSPKAGEEMADEHDIYIQQWFHRNMGFMVAGISASVASAARNNFFHPVQQYLNGLKWDAEQRLPTFLADYFGVKETPYTRAVGVLWMISAVARVMRPGCKVDTMLIIEGPQGAGKSSGLSALSGIDWYAETPIDLKHKQDAYQALRGKWIYEVGELDSFRGPEVSRIKNFCSSPSDYYRASYGKRNRDYPRHCVFAGTTNEKHYFRDRTGNRRFWPVKATHVRVDALAQDRDQLWAEALSRFASGEKWHIEAGDMIASAKLEQEERMVADDPWKSLIIRWLGSPTVPVEGSTTERSLIDLTLGFTTEDALMGACGVRRENLTPAHASRVGTLLGEIGYSARQRRIPGDWTIRERAYFRDETDDVTTQEKTRQ